MCLININLPMKTRQFRRYEMQENSIACNACNLIFYDHATRPRQRTINKNKLKMMFIIKSEEEREKTKWLI